MLKKLLAAAFIAAAAASPALVAPAAAETVLHRGNGAEPTSLDPLKTQGNWEAQILGDIFMGLATEGPDGKVIPGAAESWTTSEDGLTWTFKLRAGAKWSDGVDVTADDFVFAWRRMADPKNAAQYVKILSLIKNVDAVVAGQMPPDQIGAKAIDPLTLEVTLEHPAPYLPQIMAHQAAYPVPKHLVEANGDGWSQAGVHAGNGAYMLAEWKPQESVKLVKNPLFYDAANVKIDTVYFYPTDDSQAAMKRFRAGELDMQDPFPADEYEWLKENLPEQTKVFPTLTVAYLVFNSRRPPFDDKRVREAVALAYDRDVVINQILKLGETPAYAFVPPGTENYPGGAALPDKDLTDRAARVEKAKALLAEAGYGPGKPLKFTFNVISNPDGRRVATAVQQMLAEIGAEATLEFTEAKTHYNQHLQTGDFQLAGAGWVGDYNDPETFLFMLETKNKGFNYGGWSNAEYDRLVEESRSLNDLAKRGEMLKQAEQIMLADYAILPTRYPNETLLVREYVKGFQPNLRQQYRTRWMSIEGERFPLD